MQVSWWWRDLILTLRAGVPGAADDPKDGMVPLAKAKASALAPQPCFPLASTHEV